VQAPRRTRAPFGLLRRGVKRFPKARFFKKYDQLQLLEACKFQ
jgi:hypothetical protein